MKRDQFRDFDNLFSAHKVLRHSNRVELLSEGKVPSPVCVRLAISDYRPVQMDFEGERNGMFDSQNAKAGTVDHNPRRFIETDRAIALIDNMAEMGVKAVELTGGGDPAAHPDHLAICKHVLERNLDLSFVTTGVGLTGGVEDVLAKASGVRVLLDCSRPSAYATLHGCRETDFSAAMDSLRLIASARRRALRDGADENDVTVLGIECPMHDGINELHEMKSLLQMAYGAGVDYVLLVRRAAWPAAQAVDVMNRLERVLLDLSVPAGLALIDRVMKTRSRPPRGFCGYQYLAPYIGADLNVYRCPRMAYSEGGLLGSVAEQSFIEFWQSSEAALELREFDALSKCFICPYAAENALLACESKEHNPLGNFL